MSFQKHTRYFLCWMVAIILLAVSVGSPTAASSSGAVSAAVSQDAGSGNEQEDDSSNQTTVGELSLDAVVISLFSFHLSHDLLPFLPSGSVFPENLSARLFVPFSESLFFFSYFQKVFGKQIAANAP